MDISIALLRSLYGFNRRANQKLLQVLARLPAAELQAAPSPSRSNLWRLVNHMLYTEEHFIRCCRGEDYQRRLLPDVDRLGEHWLALQNDALEFLENSSAGKLAEIVTVELGGREFQFSRWELLLQAVTHSIQHRGELSILLSEMGYPLPNMDLIVYLAEEHGIDWPWK